MNQVASDRLLTDKTVAEKLGVSVSTVWRWAREGSIPKPVKLGKNTSRWKESSIQSFLAQA